MFTLITFIGSCGTIKNPSRTMFITLMLDGILCLLVLAALNADYPDRPYHL